MVSKKLKGLKSDGRYSVEGFDQMRKSLEMAGVVNKQDRVKRQVRVQSEPIIATCVLARPGKGYSFVTIEGKQYFMHDKSIEGGGQARVGDRFSVVVRVSDTRVISAHRIASEGTESASKGQQPNKLIEGKVINNECEEAVINCKCSGKES